MSEYTIESIVGEEGERFLTSFLEGKEKLLIITGKGGSGQSTLIKMIPNTFPVSAHVETSGSKCLKDLVERFILVINEPDTNNFSEIIKFYSDNTQNKIIAVCSDEMCGQIAGKQNSHILVCPHVFNFV